MTNDTMFFRVARVIVLGLLCLYVLFPMYIAVTTSMTPFNELSTSFSWLPTQLTLRAYVEVWMRCRSGGTS